MKLYLEKLPSIRIEQHDSHNRCPQNNNWYEKVKVIDESGEIIRGDHFQHARSPNHTLTYFRGINNICSSIQQELVRRVLEISEVDALNSAPLVRWNCVLNTFSSDRQDDNFHNGTSNGETTVIYTLGNTGLLQLKPARLPSVNDVTQMLLFPNSLVVLPEEATWRYEYQDLCPEARRDGSLGDGLDKLSLILNAQRV